MCFSSRLIWYLLHILDFTPLAVTALYMHFVRTGSCKTCALYELIFFSEPYVTEDELKLMLRGAELSGAIAEDEQVR